MKMIMETETKTGSNKHLIISRNNEGKIKNRAKKVGNRTMEWVEQSTCRETKAYDIANKQ